MINAFSMPWTKLFLSGLLPGLFIYCCSAQNVGVGTSNPHPSAALDVVSNSKGLSIPSLTTAQRNAISGPKAGLFVFDTDRQTLCMYNGSNWVYFQSSVESNVALPVEQVASDGVVGDQFGYSVSISGNYAVIGAPYDDTGAGVDQGSAYIFFFNGSGWVQQAKLVASNAADNDNFGYSVAISGDYAIVGAPTDDVGANADQGSAYIFVRSGTNWTQQANINGGSGLAGDRIGYSVSIDGLYAAVGAPFDDVGANSGQGTAYVFIRSGISWTQQDYVTIPGGAASDVFGSSVSISGIQLFVGAPGDDISGTTNVGSAHVFQRSGTNWSHTQVLTYLGVQLERCGSSVAVSGNYAVVGSPSQGAAGSTGSGRAYIYNGTSWVTTPYGNFMTTMPGLNGVMNNDDQFGYTVAAGGNYLLVSAPYSDTVAATAGAAYLFQTDGSEWYFVRAILDPLGGLTHTMGFGSAVSSSYALTGSPLANGMKGKVLFLKL